MLARTRRGETRGHGASLAFADFDTRASWAYVMNRMATTTVEDTRGGALGAAFYQCLAER